VAKHIDVLVDERRQPRHVGPQKSLRLSQGVLQGPGEEHRATATRFVLANLVIAKNALLLAS
jgi:hypothetical protein